MPGEKIKILKGYKEYLKENSQYKSLISSMSQTIAKLRKKDTGWRNASERGINKAIPSVVKKGGIEISFPFECPSHKKNQTCSENNGYWNEKNYMVMDFVGYFSLLKEGGGFFT